MKSIQFLFIAVLAFSLNSSCTAQTKKQEEDKQVVNATKVEVFYFHYTRRCATCNAIERVSKDAVTEYDANKVSFAEYNLEEYDGEIKGKELDISGQTLLIVANDTKINITNEGFMNALSNPEKLKQLIKEKIDPLI
jgi:hypothetical protein